MAREKTKVMFHRLIILMSRTYGYSKLFVASHAGMAILWNVIRSRISSLKLLTRIPICRNWKKTSFILMTTWFPIVYGRVVLIWLEYGHRSVTCIRSATSVCLSRTSHIHYIRFRIIGQCIIHWENTIMIMMMMVMVIARVVVDPKKNERSFLWCCFL